MEPVVISLFRFPTSCSWMYKCVSLIAAVSHRFSVGGHGLVWMCGGIVAHTRSSGMCLAESERTNQSAFMFFSLWLTVMAQTGCFFYNEWKGRSQTELLSGGTWVVVVVGGGWGGALWTAFTSTVSHQAEGLSCYKADTFFWVSLAYHMTRTDFTHLLTVGPTLLSL